MNAILSTREHAEYVAKRLERYGFAFEIEATVGASTTFLVKSDASREIVKAALADLRSYLRNTEKHSVCKMRSLEGAQALSDALVKRNYSATISRNNSKAFPYLLTSNATRNVLVMIERETSRAAGAEKQAACGDEWSAARLAVLLTEEGFTATRSVSARSRANPFLVTTTADTRTLRQLLRQVGDEFFAEQCKNAASDGASARAAADR